MMTAPCKSLDPTPWGPEQRLAAAVLQDAIEIYLGHLARPRTEQLRRFVEVRAWLAIDDHGWVFSFVSVCEFLGMDPEWIRRRLGRMAALAAQSAARSTAADDVEGASGHVHAA